MNGPTKSYPMPLTDGFAFLTRSIIWSKRGSFFNASSSPPYSSWYGYIRPVSTARRIHANASSLSPNRESTFAT